MGILRRVQRQFTFISQRSFLCKTLLQSHRPLRLLYWRICLSTRLLLGIFTASRSNRSSQQLSSIPHHLGPTPCQYCRSAGPIDTLCSVTLWSSSDSTETIASPQSALLLAEPSEKASKMVHEGALLLMQHSLHLEKLIKVVKPRYSCRILRIRMIHALYLRGSGRTQHAHESLRLIHHFEVAWPPELLRAYRYSLFCFKKSYIFFNQVSSCSRAGSLTHWKAKVVHRTRPCAGHFIFYIRVI